MKKGIDISEWQTEINYSKLKQQRDRVCYN